MKTILTEAQADYIAENFLSESENPIISEFKTIDGSYVTESTDSDDLEFLSWLNEG